jgi:hypothetical protein
VTPSAAEPPAPANAVPAAPSGPEPPSPNVRAGAVNGAPPEVGGAPGAPPEVGKAPGAPPEVGETPAAAGEAPLVRVLDVATRVGGGVVATLLAVLFALVTALLVPLRVGPVPVPVSFLIAVGGNVVLVWFARRATGSRIGIVVPCVAWLGTMVVLGARTTEGDLVVPGDWRGLGVLFLGATALAVAAFLAIAPPRPSTLMSPVVTDGRKS